MADEEQYPQELVRAISILQNGTATAFSDTIKYLNTLPLGTKKEFASVFEARLPEQVNAEIAGMTTVPPGTEGAKRFDAFSYKNGVFAHHRVYVK